MIDSWFSQGRRNKKLFWLPAIAPLISVVLSTLLVYLTSADEHGIMIIKHIKKGLNPTSVHQLQFNNPHIGEVAKIGLIVAIVALTVGVKQFNSITKPINITHFSFFCAVMSNTGSNCSRQIFCIHKRIPHQWKPRNDCHGIYEHFGICHFLLCCNWWDILLRLYVVYI